VTAISSFGPHAPVARLPDPRLIGLRVLIADDSRFMRELLKAMLYGIGVGHVIEAENGAVALAEMAREMVHLVFVDMMMGPIDGIELCQLLRKDAYSPDRSVPIVMVTGYTDAFRIRRARDAGVTEIMAKPISLDAVYRRVLAVLEKPRPFIAVRHYVGPDRRRTSLHHAGAERRDRS